MPIHIVDHPLVHDALVTLRDKRTTPEYFRRAATQISVLLAAEALRDLPTSDVTVDTPIGPAEGRRVSTDVIVVPILRAGRRARCAPAGGRDARPDCLHRRRAGRRAAGRAAPSRRDDLYAGRRSLAQRAEVHRSRPRRLRRSAVRHVIAAVHCGRASDCVRLP
jgi:hypothetical protein